MNLGLGLLALLALTFSAPAAAETEDFDSRIVLEVVSGSPPPPGAEHVFGDWYVLALEQPEALEDIERRLGVRRAAPLRHVVLDDVLKPGPGSAAPGVRAAAFPNDPLYSSQWHIPAVDAPEVWPSTRGAGVKVAVLDTGIDPGPDMACHTISAGYNAFTGATGPSAALDDHWHGTHMAGTIAQCTDNGVGVAGLADAVELIPVKVLDDAGSGDEVSVALGIEWARLQGVDIINLSLTFGECSGDWDDDPLCVSPLVSEAIDRAVADDIVVVAASGNNASPYVAFPANHPDTVAVGALEEDLSRLIWSHTGADLSLTAPGVDVLQETLNLPLPGHDYYYATGTSSAAAHVAGVAALLTSLHPHVPAPNVAEAIMETAVDLGNAGWDEEFGFGLVDADASLPSSFLAVERWWGSSRYGTAAAISAISFPSGAATVYVASGEGFADALPGGAAAAHAGSPLLLVSNNSVPDVVASELDRLGPSEIVVLGGPLTIADAVLAELQSMTGATVSRLSGPNRYATAAAVASASFSGPVDAAFVVSGLGFADGVSAGPAAGKLGGPVLLTDPAELAPETGQVLIDLDPSVVYVVGGDLAVSDSVVDELESLDLGPVIRVSGSDRYDTSRQLADTFFMPGEGEAGVVSGLAFPDALTLGAVVEGPVLLTPTHALVASAIAALERLEPDRIFIGGGQLAVSAQVALDLADFIVPGPAAARFTEVATEVGIGHLQQSLPPISCVTPACDAEYMSGGAAAGDIDGDGDVDVFMTRLDDTDILYCNQLSDTGHAVFVDCSANAGLTSTYASNGAAMGDIDADGDLDLFVGTVGETAHLLYVNDGSGSFSEEALARGVAQVVVDHHSVFGIEIGDYDLDGYNDIFVAEWRPLPNQGDGYTRLFRNRGSAQPGYFDDVTDAAGVSIKVDDPCACEFGFAPVLSDIDDDGWPDVAVAADFGTSRLFWNNGDGTFADGTAAANVGTDENGMGSTIGDYDGDGDLDWFVTSIHGAPPGTWGDTGNRLYQNEGSRVFSDATDTAGVRDGDWGWGAAFIDYDNDGYRDVIMTNGVDFPISEALPYRSDPMRLWAGASMPMSEVSESVGITDRRTGKALVVLDFDGDGDEDILVANTGTVPILLRNDGGNRSDWVQVLLRAATLNRFGLGARVVVEESGSTWVIEVGTQTGFLGTSEPIAHFGLGAVSGTIDAVTVEWPDGTSQVLIDILPNSRHIVMHP